MAAIKSQGTELYFIDAKGELKKLTCPTGITGINSGSKSQINSTCLSDTVDEQFVGGLRSPGAVSIPYNVHRKDESHIALDTLDKSGDLTDFMVCLSDGTTAPTLTSGAIIAPTGRTCVAFKAYISENTWDVAQNEIVKGNLSIQRSGEVTKHYPV